jgi:AraC-like DNA-binding protein
MTAHEINIILQVSCVTILAIIGTLLVKCGRNDVNTWVGVGLVASVICYLLLPTLLIQSSKLLFVIAVTGSISIPVIFFLLTMALFDDHFRASWTIAILFGIQIATHFWVYLQDIISLGPMALQACYIVSQIVAIGFVVAGIYTAVKTGKGDLIEARMKFRNTFIFITAAIIGITLIVESMPILKESIDGLQILQRSSILGLSFFFLIKNFDIRSGFFFKFQQPKEKPLVVEDSQLRRKLEALINEQKVYRKEGLTIKELAVIMGEQEYKVRRLINGQLEFRNFNDFLNKYRVTEACEILNDASQNRKTILEIAYSLGYQSIGPFNKAFKELKGMTPTAYRKALKF